jgi:hypothetical protein
VQWVSGPKNLFFDFVGKFKKQIHFRLAKFK